MTRRPAFAGGVRWERLVIAAMMMGSIRGVAQDAASREAEWSQAAVQVLTASSRAEHGEIRFRPGTKSADNADRVAGMVERELKRVCGLLEVSNDAHYTVLLFDDFAEARAVLKLPEPVEGITWGTTVATKFDNDQGTKHEMIHCVANGIIGPAANGALAEGLANGLLESVHGVRVHAPASYFRRKGRLPALSEVLDASDLVAWDEAHPGAHAYDIAGSWMWFLLETGGSAKLKQYYRGGAVEEVYGVKLAALEKEWLAALDKFEFKPEEEAALALRYDLADLAEAVARVLGASAKAAHGDVHFRAAPGRTENAVRVARMMDEEVERVCARLEVANDVHYRLLLFEDAAELSALLKIPEGADRAYWGTAIATTFDNEQGTLHAMGGLVADAKLGAPRDRLAREGLMGALRKSSRDLPAHAAAKYQRSKGRMPALSEMLEASDMDAWAAAHQDAHWPSMAESWVQFLLETRGPAKFKQYYREGATQEVLGAEVGALEKEWMAAVDAYRLRPEEAAVLATRIDQVSTPITLIAGERLSFDGGQVASTPAGQGRRIYQWRKNKADVAGESGAELYFKSVAPTDSGVYEVTVRNAKGATIGAKKWELVVIDPAKLGLGTRH